jgi:hypothetical protein
MLLPRKRTFLKGVCAKVWLTKQAMRRMRWRVMKVV